jgi:hypothetical protein
MFRSSVALADDFMDEIYRLTPKGGRPVNAQKLCIRWYLKNEPLLGVDDENLPLTRMSSSQFHA